MTCAAAHVVTKGQLSAKHKKAFASRRHRARQEEERFPSSRVYSCGTAASSGLTAPDKQLDTAASEILRARRKKLLFRLGEAVADSKGLFTLFAAIAMTGEAAAATAAAAPAAEDEVELAA